jgi:hypothetical protein
MKRLINGARPGMRRLLCLSLVLCSVCAGFAVQHWCWYICGQNGVKNEKYCGPRGEDPCGDQCLRYIFAMKVTCYFCAPTSESYPPCNTYDSVWVPSEKWAAACGQDPLFGNCICLEPYLLQDEYSTFECPRQKYGTPCPD